MSQYTRHIAAGMMLISLVLAMLGVYTDVSWSTIIMHFITFIVIILVG